MAVYGESFQKNLSGRDIKFNDFSSLVNIKKDGGILFNGPPIVKCSSLMGSFSSKQYFLSDWLEDKRNQGKKFTLLVVNWNALINVIVSLFF
jgi:hypothetical protein